MTPFSPNPGGHARRRCSGGEAAHVGAPSTGSPNGDPAFERDRPLLARGSLCEVRYEDLVADMPGQMRHIYQTLDLGEFDRVLPAIRQYVAARAGYQTNRYQIPPEMREQVSCRWTALARGESL